MKKTQITKMKPTQHTVGMIEVKLKMVELMEKHESNTLEKYLKTHPIPSIEAPNGAMYLIDRHHMGLALMLLSDEWEQQNKKQIDKINPYEYCFFNVVYDFSKTKLSMDKFFIILESLHLVHNYDKHGQFTTKPLPSKLTDLENDNFRAIAGLVRKNGGYNKIKTPYLEFQWADFFRDKISNQEIEDNLDEAIIKGVALAKSQSAKHLTGWNGVSVLNKLKSIK